MENENDRLREIEDRISHAWSEIVKMEERAGALPEQLDAFNQRLIDLNSSVSTVNEAISSINNHYADYFNKSDPGVKTKLEIVTEHHQTINQFLKAATDLKTELTDFKDFIYGNESLKKDGFKRELEGLFEKNKTSHEKLHGDWSVSYQTLYDKIEGLLPGATATGLSKAYQDQKNNYKWPVVIWSAVFGLTVAGMMYYGIHYYYESKDLNDSLRHILTRLPFFIPAVWLAIFASKQQSQYKRLQQEYVYKETLAKSYEAYKREIDRLPDGIEKSQLQEKLITSMVEMCGYNPSLTLEHKSHDDKPPLPGATLLERFNGKKKEVIDAKT